MAAFAEPSGHVEDRLAHMSGSEPVKGAASNGAGPVSLQHDASASNGTGPTTPSTQGSSQDLAEDGYPRDMEIPIRYIKGMGGDPVEARRRWIETLKWRSSYKVDGILQEPQLHFDVIKKYYPHFVHKRSKEGCLVYYEIPGKIDLAALRQNGVDVPGLLRHYTYITEFIWDVLDTREEARLLTVLDLRGVKMSSFAGEAVDFLKQAARLIAAHYPERSHKIFILNSPWWFNMIWKVVAPLLHPNTKAKITVAGSDYMVKLGELIELEDIPEEIGGKDKTPILQSPEEVALREHVMSVLASKDLQQVPEVSSK